MKISIQQKLEQIQELLRQKTEIERKLEELLQPQIKNSLPVGFSVYKEVLSIIHENASSPISRPEIVAKLGEKYPDLGIDKGKVASALAYLKNDLKKVKIVARGLYKLASEQERENE